MDELIAHLEKGIVIHQFRGKYNNVIRSLYIVIRRALRDGATKIEINENAIIIWIDEKIIDEIRIFDSIPNGAKIHIDNMLLLLEKDHVVNKYVTANVIGDTLVCLISSG